MSIYPTQKDELEEERHYERLDAKIERLEEGRTNKLIEEQLIWDGIKRDARKVADDPSYDYGVPYWAFMQFISELQNKCHIEKREPETDF